MAESGVKAQCGFEGPREDEGGFRRFAQSVPDVFCRFDRDQRHLYISPAIERITGLPASHFLGKTVREVNAEIWALWDSKIRAAFESGEAQTVEFSVPAIDGEVRHYEMRMLPELDGHGKVETVLGVARDITRRKRVEDRLRESEERFRRLVEVSARRVWITNAEGEPQTDSMFWDGSQENGSRRCADPNWLEKVHPEDRRRTAELWYAALKTVTPYRAEYRRLREGEYRDILAHAAPILNADGTVREWVGMSTDITEQKRTEWDLAQAIQRLDAHMDNSPLAVIELNAKSIITRWSKEAERVFGWTAAEVLGRGMWEIPWVYVEDVEAVRRVSQGMYDRARPRNLSRNRNYRKDGSVIECEWYNSAIYDEQGNLTSILSQVLDVTERNRAEERLREAQKMESIAMLAGGLAHDFNNLLVGVVGNASVAGEMLPAGSPMKELLARIVKSGEQAAHLTRQMLAYSGKGQFVVAPVDLTEVVREVTDLVRSTAPKKIAIELDLEPRLPSIEADRSQIHQVLMNLVINATEAVGDEAGMVVIQTGTQELDGGSPREFGGTEIVPGQYVFLEVRDTGCGMDKATQARIFDPFFTTKFLGRGLGLAAVRGIVRGHKGAIRVRSAPGRGTSFQVLFPAIGWAESRPQASEAAEQLRPALRMAGAILVVDDEEPVRTMAKLALEMHGCTVLTAGSGAEAVRVLSENADTIFVALLDLSMPGMSGQEALPKLLAVKSSLKAVVSSGYSEADALRLFQGMPVAGFIQKPYTVERLVEKINSVTAKATGGES
jgi:two-component system cell cycle sensor histidine kinase/response regulator CckA